MAPVPLKLAAGLSLVALALAVTSTATAPSAAIGIHLSGAAAAAQQAKDTSLSSRRQGIFQPVTMADFRAHAKAAKTHSPVFRGGGHAQPTRSTSPTHTSIASPSAPRVVLYAGLNKDGIKAADNGSARTPPDSTGSIGPSHYVEMANSIIHVWNRSLASVSAAKLDAFVGAPGAPMCDPQIQWDPTANRWLFSILYCNVSDPVQVVLFGWSKTSNPSNLTTGWCTFAIETQPDILDFPKLGHNNGWLIVGGNMYNVGLSTTNPPFDGAALLWAQLPGSTVSTCPSTFPTFGTAGPGLTNELGVKTFTPVPVNTAAGASDGYILSAYDPSGAAGNAVAPQSKIAVRHLTAAGTLVQDASVDVSTYDTPPAAREPGGTLDTLVGNLTQAVGDPIHGIWTQHTVSGGAGTKVAWYEFKIGAGTNLALTQEGAVTHATQDVYNAAISPNYVNSGAAIFYNRSDTSNNPLIAAQTRTSATALGVMAPGELVLATSPAADADFSCSSPYGPPCRWGDYSGASPDPVSQYAVWGTGVYNTANTSTPAWRDRNFAVPTAPAGAPTGVTPWYGGTDYECLTWTAPASNGGTAILTYTINTYDGVTLVKSVTTSGPTTHWCITGLTPGVTYTFKVEANNGAGPGPESAPTSPVLISRNSSQSTSAASSSRPGAQPGSGGSPGPR